MVSRKYGSICIIGLFLVMGCQEDAQVTNSYTAIVEKFGDKIDPQNQDNYQLQFVPPYITKDNGISNPITDEGATLGRVLFYDLKLSVDNTIACASCHLQAKGFSDMKLASEGVNGLTMRHSMRLINSRFANERRFFWDERAISLEDQTTQPIQDHNEMGFSGNGGDPNLDNLLAKLQGLPYYQELFTVAYGDQLITETRIQLALSQFVRSIQSFDSKYDEGRTQVNNDNAPFPNFTPIENLGKSLFMMPPQFDPGGNRIGGGAGCQGCHRAPEFDIDPNSRNNGVVGVLGSQGIDLNNTRSPSLRNLINSNGVLVSRAMHNASMTTIQEVIDHYNEIVVVPGNNNIDPRLTPGGNPQRLNLTPNERDAIVAFLKTLTGTSVFTDPKWSNPF